LFVSIEDDNRLIKGGELGKGFLVKTVTEKSGSEKPRRPFTIPVI
jgi:hypothetical protein